MARNSVAANSTSDIDAINLSRALARLEQKILSPNPSPRLLHSSYERAKTAANLEYARTLLLRLEHTTSTLRIQSRKQALQTDLLRQRNLLKRLNDRLYDLSQRGDDNFSDGSSEDLLGEDQANQEATSPLPTSPTVISPTSPSLDRRKDLPSSQPPTSTLRSRTKLPTPTSQTTALSPRSPTSPPPSTTILEADTSTQAALTSSLLTLATSLKSSSLALSAALETDSSVLATTASALDKNTDGMTAASKRMGVLRRMSEGRWWWGRMVLYAGIAGLWVLAGGLVFLGPKVRF